MKEIILAVCGAFVCVEKLQIHLRLRFDKKPLNCSVCLAGWFCLILSVPSLSIYTPFYMAVAMILQVPLTKIMKAL
jgi:hypothetical protein